jgi:7-carboxy-7-deazaguanine synthase
VTYSIKEIYYTLQGEGARTGRPCVLLRFAGCNLWTGREPDRAAAVCRFCDTDFFGTDGERGGKYETAETLAAAVREIWGHTGNVGEPYVVCTGGEPLLQLDAPLIAGLHGVGFEVAVETNGTKPVPRSVDWVCVSPKANAPLVQLSGDELKVVIPQDGLDLDELRTLDFRWFYVQPMDGPDIARNTDLAVRFCLEHPPWRLSLQTHKLIGIR